MNGYLSEIKNVERRKRELLILQLLILGLLTATVIILSLLEQKFLTLFFFGLLSVLFCVYILDKEKELKVLNHHLLEEQIKNIEEKIQSASIQDKLSEMRILYKVGRVAVSFMDVQKKLNRIFHIALRLVRADRGSVMLVDDRMQQFVFAVTYGLDPVFVHGVVQKMEDGVAGWVLEHKAPLLLTGNPQDSRFKNFIEKTEDLASSVSLPLKIRGKVIGTLNFSYREGSQKMFTDYDVRRLAIFAHYIAVAIERTPVKSHERVHSLSSCQTISPR